MNSNVKHVTINIVSGGAGYIVPMAINIFSTPFVINSLGYEAYGLLTIANVVIGYLIVADMGLDIPITRKIAEYYATNENERKSQFLTATIKIYFVIGLVGMLLMFSFTNLLIRLLAIPSEMYEKGRIVFYLAGIGFFCSIINMWGKAVFNGLHRYEIANGVSIFNNLFGIIFGIILIKLGYGVVGFFIARIIGFALSNVINIILALRHIGKFNLLPYFNREILELLKRQIGYGFMLRISGMIFSKMDQTLIGIWVSIAAVAAYSLPILIATALSGLIASIAHFAFPMASAMLSTHSIKEMEPFFFKITKFVVVLATLSFVPFIVLGDKFMALWINSDLAGESQIVLILLLIAFYLNTCLNVAFNVFFVGIGELKSFTFYSVVRGICLFIGFIILIKFYGMNGAGLSYICSLIVDAVFVFYSLNRKLKFNVRSLIAQSYAKPMLMGCALGVGLYLIRDWVSTWSLLFLAISAFVILYLLFALSIRVFDEKEKNLVMTLLKKK